MTDQVVIVDNKTGGIKKDPINQNSGIQLIINMEELLPYMAAFGYGAIAGYFIMKDSEDIKNSKNPQIDLMLDSVRTGFEATIFFKMANSLPSSATPSPTQLFGVAGLTAIGASLALVGGANLVSNMGQSLGDMFNNWLKNAGLSGASDGFGGGGGAR